MKSLRDLAIVRSAVAPVAFLPQQRADMPDEEDLLEEGMPTMTVEFSRFGVWYPIRSFWEGEFLERIAPGAFKKTIAEVGLRAKVFFNHGQHPAVGDFVLGTPTLLEERADSPYAEVPLDDTSFNRDLLPGLRKGAYGSSFMFNVLREEWVDEPTRSTHNPDGLAERTITEVRLLEFGPVTWPANPGSTAGLRSGTDWYADSLRTRSPERFDEMTKRFDDFRAQHGLRTPESDAALRGTSDDGAASSTTDAPDTLEVHHSTGLSPSGRAARLRALRHPFLKQEAS